MEDELKARVTQTREQLACNLQAGCPSSDNLQHPLLARRTFGKHDGLKDHREGNQCDGSPNLIVVLCPPAGKFLFGFDVFEFLKYKL